MSDALNTNNAEQSFYSFLVLVKIIVDHRLPFKKIHCD